MVASQKSQRIGVFGGSFDPVHVGHLIMAEACREALGLDQVLMIPAAISPLKPHGPVASNQARWEMLQLAIGGTNTLGASDVELRRGGVSYTVDTVRELKREHPAADWMLLVGADSVNDMSRWHKIDELLTEVQLGVVQRGGHPAPDFAATRLLLPEVLQAFFAPQLVPMPALEISSSDLRERVRTGRSIRFRVPRAVEAYIEAERVYR